MSSSLFFPFSHSHLPRFPNSSSSYSRSLALGLSLAASSLVNSKFPNNISRLGWASLPLANACTSPVEVFPDEVDGGRRLRGVGVRSSNVLALKSTSHSHQHHSPTQLAVSSSSSPRSLATDALAATAALLATAALAATSALGLSLAASSLVNSKLPNSISPLGWASLSLANASTSPVEPKTGEVFPDEVDGGRRLLGVGVRRTNVLGLKSIDVYAFGD